jgi:hypothetical protein
MNGPGIKPVGFRDIASSFVPGFVLVGAFLRAGWVPAAMFSSWPELLKISAGAVVCYVAGQVCSSISTFLILELFERKRDPRVYLIGAAPAQLRWPLNWLFPSSDFADAFKTQLVRSLNRRWGTGLVTLAPSQVYYLCIRLVHQNSPSNAYLLDRLTSLANMHGGLVLSLVVLATVLFFSLETIWLACLCLVAAALSMRRWYVNRVRRAKLIYETYYIL